MKAIDASTDVGSLADAILSSASIIPASKKPHVAALLAQLKPGGAPQEAAAAAAPASGGSTGASGGGGGSKGTAAAAAAAPPKGASRSERADSKEEEPTGMPAADEIADWDDPSARLEDVGAYVEKLYEEDLGAKTEAARKIVALAQHARNPLQLQRALILLSFKPLMQIDRSHAQH